MLKNVSTLLLLFLLLGCKKRGEVDLFITSILNGTTTIEVNMDGLPIPNSSVLSGGQLDNNYDFEKVKSHGSISLYGRYNLPDSAHVVWSYTPYEYLVPNKVGVMIRSEEMVKLFGEYRGRTSYEAYIKLPPYPKLKRGEKYRICLVVAYEDSVYTRIEAVKK